MAGTSLLALLDDFLAWPPRRRQRFALARRLGWVMSLRHFALAGVEDEAEQALRQLEAQGREPDEALAMLRGRTM